jgi:hypothetical protein
MEGAASAAAPPARHGAFERGGKVEDANMKGKA